MATAEHLTAFQPAIGPQPANSRLYSSEPVVLEMKEKVFSLSGDDFTVKLADGTDVVKVKGKALSARDKKKFFLPGATKDQDQELFTVSDKVVAMHSSYHGKSPSGHDFEVKGKFKLMGSKSAVTFKNASDGSQVELEVKGDFLDRSAEVTFGGRPVAKIARKVFNKREIVGDKQTYYVLVAPNVDLSLIAALCVCLDDREND